MAKPGYQAVALDPGAADMLRAVSYVLSTRNGTRITLSQALDTVIRDWASRWLDDPYEVTRHATDRPAAEQVTHDHA
jgi:hypothetical protein